MKKRVLSIILASCMSIGLLAGCSTTTVEEAGEATPADAPAATEAAPEAETTDSTSSETVTGEGDHPRIPLYAGA